MSAGAAPDGAPRGAGASAPFPIQGVGLSMHAAARSWGEREPETLFGSGPIGALAREFPSVPWALMDRVPEDALVIPERAWRAASADLYAWDRAVGELLAQPRWLVVEGNRNSRTLGDTAREILTRYQRLVPRTNTASGGSLFRRVLAGHRALHDPSLPLVRADYDHALDVWQWTLRLMPNASLALQLAALFHDVERLVSEAERRIEHHAADYQAFKNDHARRGAELAAEVLAASGVDTNTIAAVSGLIREHELPGGGAGGGDAGLLADADALSFFSLNSPGFADYYGAEHTLTKVRYSLGRMSAGAIRRLASIRLREDVARLLRTAVLAEASTTLREVSDA